jgi:hypothetical protein
MVFNRLQSITRLRLCDSLPVCMELVGYGTLQLRFPERLHHEPQPRKVHPDVNKSRRVELERLDDHFFCGKSTSHPIAGLLSFSSAHVLTILQQLVVADLLVLSHVIRCDADFCSRHQPRHPIKLEMRRHWRWWHEGRACRRLVVL